MKDNLIKLASSPNPANRQLAVQIATGIGGEEMDEVIDLANHERCSFCDGLAEKDWVCDLCEEPICYNCNKGGAWSLHDVYEGCICSDCRSIKMDVHFGYYD